MIDRSGVVCQTTSFLTRVPSIGDFIYYLQIDVGIKGKISLLSQYSKNSWIKSTLLCADGQKYYTLYHPLILYIYHWQGTCFLDGYDGSRWLCSSYREESQSAQKAKSTIADYSHIFRVYKLWESKKS